ncbi:MAG: ATP-binding cassette domain-containing protein [Clostridiales bacterium]|nr:ATP-binding cassette domain-containing protein [Clostridiales bacterium]
MLELKNVCFRVEDASGRKEIVDHVNLTIPDGKLTVVTGPNGGGKSTIARLIMGIEVPTSGQILFNGTDITHMTVTERAKLGIGYAFQQPPRFKGLTVRRLLSLAAGRELGREECCEYLTGVGLCARDYLDREVDASLSGGEMKRIEIASIMVRCPKLSIYDEPEAGIDLWSFTMLVDSFTRLVRERHDSMLIISHQERIMELADTIIVIAGGKVSEMGSREEILPGLMEGFRAGCAYRGEDA